MRLSMMSMVMMMVDRFSAEETVDLARELAFDGIDWVTCHGRQPADLRRLTDDAGLPCAAYTFWVDDLSSTDVTIRQRGLELLKREIETAHILGAPVLMIPTPGVEELARDELRRRWIVGLAEAAPLVHDAGLILTIENYPGALSPFVIADDIREALDVMPELRVTFDNGNASTGECPVVSFQAVANKTVHAHFKDWEISDEKTPASPSQLLDGKYYGPALISEGALSRGVVHRACLQAMKNAGYQGCINIEYESNQYRADEGIRRAAAYLRALADEIGW